jgi:hypothetical protein
MVNAELHSGEGHQGAARWDGSVLSAEPVSTRIMGIYSLSSSDSSN